MTRPLDRVLADTPLAAAMDLQQVSATPVILSAPFALCRNQLGVGFGGAIATGLTLAGWVAAVQALEASLGETCNPVVAQATQTFSAPFTDAVLDFVAPDLQPNSEWVEQRRAGSRIRISMTTTLHSKSGVLCANNQLLFVL